MLESPPAKELHQDWGHSGVLRFLPTQHYKAIVVSDLHLPRSDSHPKYLAEFLRHHTCDVLILLGDTHEGYDIVLGEPSEMQQRVFDLIAARKEEGTMVIDVPGNHDSYKRRDGIIGHRAFGTEYWNDLVLPSALGPTYLFHGDALDGNMRVRYDKVVYSMAKKISVGGKSLVDIYSALEKITHLVYGGTKKRKVRDAGTEFGAAAMAIEHDCEAVLMGHSHKPAPFAPASGNADIMYGNSGSWVGGMCTAMALRMDGNWEFIDWNKKRDLMATKKPHGAADVNPCLPFRDAAREEYNWQKAQHRVYTREALVLSLREAIEKMEKTKKKIVAVLGDAEEQLEEARVEMASLNRYADVASIPASQAQPILPLRVHHS